MSLKTNSDFISPTVAKMVRCSDTEFAAFRKMKYSKKKAIEGAKAIPTVRAALITPISEVMGIRVFVVPPEVLRDAIVTGEPSNVIVEVAGEVEAFSGERPPMRTEGES